MEDAGIASFARCHLNSVVVFPAGREFFAAPQEPFLSTAQKRTCRFKSAGIRFLQNYFRSAFPGIGWF